MASTAPYPQAVALAMLSAIVCLLDLPPLIWHLRNRNAAAVCLVFWILINNFFSLVNAIIWPNDNMSTWFDGVGLCDVEAKIIIGRSFGIASATLCILRSLANVMDQNKITIAPSRAQRMRATAFDLIICIGIPLLAMVFHYIVQPNRYAIAGISGCVPTDIQGPVTIVLLDFPPLILAVVDLYYAGPSLHPFLS